MASQVSTVKAGCSGPVSLKGSDPTKTVGRDPGTIQKPERRAFGSCISRPQVSQNQVSQNHVSQNYVSPRITGAIIRLVLAHPGFRTEGRKSLDRCLLWRTGGCPRNPCGSCRREAKTKSAPNKGRLGHLRCARQGLVRDSESNTKYGGKRGKTGAMAAPVMVPSIGESRGIPKLKKTCSLSPAILSPALHRQGPYSPSGSCIGETHGCLRKALGWHARPRGSAKPASH